LKKLLTISFALAAVVSLSACDTVGKGKGVSDGIGKGKGKAPVEVTG